MAWKNLPSPADGRMGMHALPGRNRPERISKERKI